MAEPLLNPNATRNRVPEGQELAFIRARVSHLQSVVDRDTHEANEAFAIYEATKIRYDAQVLALQELQSQLYIAKQTADSLKRHTLSLGEELEALRGLIHPIRRCSDDVLRTVFELIVTPDTDEEEQGDWGWENGAIQLSHVCQRWRALSLSTPRVWSCVSFKIHEKNYSIDSMVSAFVRRVKHIPAKINFALQLSETTYQRAVEVVKNIPFRRIYSVPNISAINFFGGATHGPASLLNSISRFPDKTFDSLSIHFDMDQPDGETIYQFISRFCPFRKLKLEEIYLGPVVASDLSEAFAELETLDLRWVYDTPLLQLLQMMPKLQTLEVTRCNMVPSADIGASGYTLLNLRSLDVRRGDFPWTQIDCPNLILLSLDISDVEAEHEEIWGFVSKTKSIREVTIHHVKAGDLSRLARVATQLERLHLTNVTDSPIMSVLVNWQQSGLEGPAFPQLLALTLLEPSRDLRSLTLDSLIRSRCFPVGHPESTMDSGIIHALKDFRVTMEFCNGREKWLDSRLLGTYFSRSGDNPVEIAGAIENDSVDICVPCDIEICYAFIGNTDEAQ